MEVKFLTTPDKIRLTYYIDGEGNEETVVIFNAPGMSVKFWIPIISELRSKFKIICMEYRGFPDKETEIPKAQMQFKDIVNDFLWVLEKEKIKCFHALSWCLGAKVMLNVYDNFPDRLITMHALNMAYKRSDGIDKGPFSQLIQQLKKRLDQDNASIDRIIKIMSNIGTIPSFDFLSLMDAEEDPTTLDLYGFLENESSMSSLAFYLIDHPVGLKNYLSIYESFSSNDQFNTLKECRVPLYVYIGENDQMVTFKEKDHELFDSEMNIFPITVKNGSHFMLIEASKKIAGLIQSQIATIPT